MSATTCWNYGSLELSQLLLHPEAQLLEGSRKELADDDSDYASRLALQTPSIISSCTKHEEGQVVLSHHE